MSHARRCAAVLILTLFTFAVLAQALPPVPAELGTIRRNEQGQLEVIRMPAASQAAADGLVADKAAGPGQALEKKWPNAAAGGRTLVVGPQEQIRSITEAARLARDGDTIEILPGEYRQQAVVWLQGRLTVRGRGKRPVFIADGDHAEGKGLWVVRNAEMLIENIEFRGARVADGNGAGIRFERGHLRIVRCASSTTKWAS
jgi:hypothetical protein